MPADPERWEDDELARRAAAREEAAWQELLRRAGPAAQEALRRVLRRGGASDPEGEAVAALTDWALVLLEREGETLKRYRPGVPLAVYLAAVARHVGFRILRARRRTLSLEDADPVAPIPETPEVELPQLREALAGLPPRERLVLQLLYWDQVGYEAAGRLLGIRPDSVGPLASRARARLREALLGKSSKP